LSFFYYCFSREEELRDGVVVGGRVHDCRLMRGILDLMGQCMERYLITVWQRRYLNRG
jgi:hypothetical protein